MLPRGSPRSCIAFQSRPIRRWPFLSSKQPNRAVRSFNTASNVRQKKQVYLTPKGSSSKQWGELNVKQKIARTSTVGVSLLTIVAGIALTSTVFYLLYVEVFAPDSKANWFNTTVNRIKKDPRCIALLGSPNSIKAYGEPTWNRWARSRPIASTVTTDRYGNKHLKMRFNLEGDLDKGVAHVHLMKRPNASEYEYRYLFIDVRGKPRLFLESVEKKQRASPKSKKEIFGIRWGRE